MPVVPRCFVLAVAGAVVLGLAGPPASAVAQARPAGSPAPASADVAAGAGRDPRLDLLRGIQLAPRQRARIDSIEAAFAGEARRREAQSASAVETVIALQARAGERQRAIRAALTPAQRGIFDRNLAELRAWMRREIHH